MRVLRIIMIVLATMMVAFLLWNLTLSGTYEASISKQIDASAGDISREINDFENWTDWATFLNRDSSLTITTSTPSAGTRAWVTWSTEAGPGGRMEMLEANDTAFEILMIFQGFKAAHSQITLQAEEASTTVSWSITGELPFYARFMKESFQEIVRNDLNQSLGNLSDYFIGETTPQLDGVDESMEGLQSEDSLVSASTDSTHAVGSSAVREKEEGNRKFVYSILEGTPRELQKDRVLKSFESVREFLGEKSIGAPMVVAYDEIDPVHQYMRLFVGTVVNETRRPRQDDLHVMDLPAATYLEFDDNSEDITVSNHAELDSYLKNHGFHLHGTIIRVWNDPNKTDCTLCYPVQSIGNVISAH